MDLLKLSEAVFTIVDSDSFIETAFSVFKFQLFNNPFYQKYCAMISDEEDIMALHRIPFLPVEFFKTEKIVAGTEGYKPDNTLQSQIFTSSGTSGNESSRHIVADVSLYEKSFRKGFEYFYGDIKDYCVLALLPSYLEREGSSLVYMMNDLIKRSNHPMSGFYLHNVDELVNTLDKVQAAKQKTILVGVTYALLDLVEKHSFRFPELIVMETGGMKGKRKELVREELHSMLSTGFGVNSIHSEYGMTELLSQAYSKGKGIFKTPPWMKVLIRDVNDPTTFLENGKTGGINIIDLANIFSCSFVATQDLGKLYDDGSFEVLGRFDNSDIRGCNLMVN